MKKKHFILVLLAALFLAACGEQSKYKYETVPNDPLKVRIYTLENGLKVYLSVNKDKPRVQTYIGVRVGGKNDPAETTGLAHYFEHLMFKGTKNFATSDYEAEKPMLDKIEELFETYRVTTDEEQRKILYSQIDSISQEAAKIAIPNEYDKLMSAIGAQGTNAFTSKDMTAYVENIPSNEIENWAIIQADRFTNPVLRLFHTELETVYEEYNMSVARDGNKTYEALFQGLFPHHPYGTQTVLGAPEHLKNPSITNIKEYFETYYVPNNMGICMVGDFNPDEVIAIIDKHFGQMKAKEIPEFKTEAEKPIEKPVVKEVVGIEAENISIGFRLPGASTQDAAILEVMDYLLTNGKAGILDLNLVKKQKILSGGSYTNCMGDYSVFGMYGTPKQGQTLDEVRDLLLGQLDLIKKGEIEDWLLEAVINNFRLNQYYQQQYPEYAASILLNSFIYDKEWKDRVNRIDFQSKLTKQDIIDFSNKYFKDNYVIVYKREGKPDNPKIDKPQITPVPTNRDNESAFLAEIKNREVKPIEPVFLDYTKDMSKLSAKSNLPVLYKQNDLNPLFSLYYVFEMGNNNDKALGTAFNYLKYLGTSKRTIEEIESEFYKMACSFNVMSTSDRVYVFISGLSDNFDKAVDLLEELLADAQVDQQAYDNLVEDMLKKRNNAKLDQNHNLSMLATYGMYGEKSPATNILTESELKSMNPETLVEKIKGLKNYQHTILYYGPLSEKQITETINQKHAIADNLQPVPEEVEFAFQNTDEDAVLLVDYDLPQIYLIMLNKGGNFDKAIEPVRSLYTSYFGSGMNSIVFQEMREARALAYGASVDYSRPGKIDKPYYIQAFIATQTDKMHDAVNTFNEILNNMPEAEKSFQISKEKMLTSIRTQRILREDILWNYIYSQEFGYDSDPRKELFEKIPALTLTDVKAFQEKYVKDRTYTYCILGNIKDMDMSFLQKIGKVKVLSQKEIFGY